MSYYKLFLSTTNGLPYFLDFNKFSINSLTSFTNCSDNFDIYESGSLNFLQFYSINSISLNNDYLQ